MRSQACDNYGNPFNRHRLNNNVYGIKPVELKFANWYINKLLKVCDIYLRAYLTNGCKMAYYCLLWLYTHLIDAKYE